MDATIESPGSHSRLVVIGLVLLSWLFLGVTAAHSSIEVGAEDPGLTDIARQISRGGRLRVSGLYLETRGTVQLDLDRFEVFTQDARILAGDRPLAIPDTAYYRGTVVGSPGSRAVVGFKSGGLIDGLITDGDEVWRLSGKARLSGFGAERQSILEEFRDRPFDCQTETIPPADSYLDSMEPSGLESDGLVAGTYAYSARVAVDTDWEFLQKFGGDVAAATDYVADVFAFSSTIYEQEVGTSLYISYLKWWPGAHEGTDPWTKSSCSDALNEFRDYWRSNRGAVERTLVHLLSGKSTGCGIAASPSLCSQYSSYGLSGSLSGRFDPNSPLSGSGFWDILVVSHEIGHNFGSPHTHSYCNYSGNPDPVDACVPANYGPACNGQAGVLPVGCPGAGQRCGTIMSYCHLINGGYGNIALTFGAGHTYGEQSWRVPSRMNSYVANQASYYPTCLAPVFIPIFNDGFETSNTSGWSSRKD